MTSRLPEEILLDILNKLLLEDAVKTGFLSWWQDVCKYITRSFGLSWVKSTGKELVPSVNHLICLHQDQSSKCLKLIVILHAHCPRLGYRIKNASPCHEACLILMECLMAQTSCEFSTCHSSPSVQLVYSASFHKGGKKLLETII